VQPQTLLIQGLFNFRPAVRPVPLEAHIQGYPGKFYCPRMATMNKPAYAAIMTHSPEKPTLIFVSSRRQTRLTAIGLVSYAAADSKPTQWLHMAEWQLEEVIESVKDVSLKHTLQFGIGLHHAGLPDKDRQLVEKLFCEQKIQVLVATSTLAWGVNTPAHLVIIKGTEFFDAKSKRRVPEISAVAAKHCMACSHALQHYMFLFARPCDWAERQALGL
jgi:activating signal cointegrator complex subunit 3